MNVQKLSIIIPVLNEERTIERLLRRIMRTRFPVDVEALIVDDGSRDATVSIIRRLQHEFGDERIRLLRNRVNQGKGACIRRGAKHALGEIVVVQDADLEYDPRQLPALLRPILDGAAEVVYGSRFLGTRWPRGMALPNWVANRALTWLTNLLFGTRVTDMETCYKMLPRQLLRRVRIHANRFEFEPEITAKLGKLRIPITERPIRYAGRTAKQGKKIRAKDLFIAIGTLVRQRFAARD